LEDAFGLRSRTSASDPSGLDWAEAFWNSRSHGLATVGLWSVPAFLPRSSLGGYLASPITFAQPEGILWQVGGATGKLGREEGQPGRPPALGTRRLGRPSFDARRWIWIRPILKS